MVNFLDATTIGFRSFVVFKSRVHDSNDNDDDDDDDDDDKDGDAESMASFYEHSYAKNPNNNDQPFVKCQSDTIESRIWIRTDTRSLSIVSSSQ